MKFPKLILLVSLLALIPCSANAYTPDGQLREPYLQLGTPTEITVRWRTTAASNSVVHYGTSAGSLTSTVSDSASTTEHIIKLTGLTPNTKYYYSVGSSSGTIASGPSYFFVTSPTTAKPTRIWVIGDAGHGNAAQRAVRDAYYAYTGSTHTDLWLTVGDNAYESGFDEDYTDKLFEIYPEMLRKSVLWPSAGNHDSYQSNPLNDTGPYYDSFTFPTSGQAGGVASGRKAYYSFDYGNIHFVCIESTKAQVRTTAAINWLKSDLQSYLQNPNTNWLIVYFHHSPYTKTAHDSDNSQTEAQSFDMRLKILPILEEHGVDLVLTGHSHSYERSMLIDSHYGVSATFNPGTMVKQSGNGAGSNAYLKPAAKTPHAGAVYVVAGASGKLESGGLLDHPAMPFAARALSSLVIDVNGNTLNANLIDHNIPAAVIDTFRIIKGSSGNAEPSVSLTSPVANASYASPASISLAATASDTDGTISKVEFYQGSNLIATATSSPYTHIWTGVGAGTYNITAVATDNAGAIKTSGVVPITVAGGGGGTTVTTFQEGANGYTGMIDAYIRADATTTNTGTATTLAMDGNPDYAALLKWDLSSIPAGRTVTDVKMALNVTNSTPHVYEIYALKRDWSESAATWVNATSTTTWATAGADNSTSDRGNVVLGTATTTVMGTLTITLNSAGIAQVQSWVNSPATNFGFVIQDYLAATDGLDVTSSEGATVAQRPSLTVSYAGANPITVSLQQGTNGYLGMVDAHLRGDATTTNTGAATSLLLDGTPDYSALLKWDLSSIPTDKTVTNVTLTFNVLDTSSDVYEIYALKRDWSESVTTWIKATSTVNWSVAGASDTTNDRESTILGTITAAATGSLTVPLNSAGIAKVQAWVNNPATNFGFIIQDYVNVGGLDVTSSEGATVVLRPIINITYQ